MKNKSSKEIGDFGEDIVCQYLTRNKGMSILDRNWKNRYCEIDIVAKKDSVIYFVEVKYRKSERYGDGFEAINDRKLTKIAFAAEYWVTAKSWQGDYQLLVASVNPNGVEIIEI